MQMKTLITTVILLLALASTGSGPATATGLNIQDGQDLRPVPSVPATENCTASAAQPSQELTEEFHQTYPLSPTGRVNLANINGGVTIKIWDRPAVQVDAIKKHIEKNDWTKPRLM